MLPLESDCIMQAPTDPKYIEVELGEIRMKPTEHHLKK